MDILLSFIAVIAFSVIVVGFPLSILRSLDEIKAGQRRIESRLAEFDAHPTEPAQIQ